MMMLLMMLMLTLMFYRHCIEVVYAMRRGNPVHAELPLLNHSFYVPLVSNKVTGAGAAPRLFRFFLTFNS